MPNPESIKKGREVLQQLRGGGPVSGGATEEVAPDFWEMTLGNLFGEVWTRPGLPIRDRSLITMAVLTALARTEELRGHMSNALNIGISKEEIVEMFTHVAHYAGWPTGVNAARVAKDVFSSRDSAPRG